MGLLWGIHCLLAVGERRGGGSAVCGGGGLNKPHYSYWSGRSSTESVPRAWIRSTS